MAFPRSRLVLLSCLLAVTLLCRHTSAQQETETVNWKTQWQKLAQQDPADMYPAFQKFLSHPQKGIRFLQRKLQPVEVANPKQIRHLIDKLDHPVYVERVKAFKSLQKHGFQAEAALRRAVSDADSKEMELRADRLLKKIGPERSPKEMRVWRAIEILEYIGTEEAEQVLKEIASGPKGFWQTDEARRSLKRLEQKRPAIKSRDFELLHVLRGHGGNVYSVAFSSDGNLLASGSSDDTVRVWDLKTGKQKAMLGRQNNVYGICFSRDGKYVLAGGTGDKLAIWDVAKQAKKASLTGHSSTVRDLALSPDGKLAATASYDDDVKLWDLKTHKCVATLKGHSGNVYTVAFSADGKMLASGASDNDVRLWDVDSGAEIEVLEGHSRNVYSVAFSRDGKSVVSSDSSGNVLKWELLTGRKKIGRFRNSGYRYMTQHPDGRTLAFGGGGTAILRDAVTGAHLGELAGHENSIRDLAFSSDGRLLATGSYDNTIRIWRLRD